MPENRLMNFSFCVSVGCIVFLVPRLLLRYNSKRGVAASSSLHLFFAGRCKSKREERAAYGRFSVLIGVFISLPNILNDLPNALLRYAVFAGYLLYGPARQRALFVGSIEAADLIIALLSHLLKVFI